MEALLQTQLASLTNAASSKPSAEATLRMEKTAQEFEASYLRVMLNTMMADVGDDALTGGGNAEKTYRSMLTEQYADTISKGGGIGLADQVLKEMIRLQEQQQ